MKKIGTQFIMAVVFNLLGKSAIADEYFWITHIATPYKTSDGEHSWLTPADSSYDLPSIVTIKGNKLMLNQNECNVTIDKISPFYVSRGLVDIIDAAGGDNKFKRFLNTKLHTDMGQWKTEYSVKFPDKEAGQNGCDAIQSPFIYRSANELIITDTSFFYRLVLRKEKRVKDVQSVTGYVFSPMDGRGCVSVTKKLIAEKINYCAYSDDVDVAQHMKFKYKCFIKDGVNHDADHHVNDYQIYDSKNKCVDDYHYMKERSEYQG